MFGSKELAYAITIQDYELFMAINQVLKKNEFFVLMIKY
jgi:hypothetical protein